MSEHHPDMDQIMALAAGLLPADQAARFEEALDPEARMELAAQRAALEALGRLPRPTMSAEERRRMHAAVRTELNLEAIRPPRPARQRYYRGSWLARALPALAAVASLVAVIGIALNLADGDDYEEVAAKTQATYAPMTTMAVALSTTEAPPAEPAFEDVEEEAVLYALPAVEEETADAGVAAKTTTTESAAPTTISAPTTESSRAAMLAVSFSTDRPDEMARSTEVPSGTGIEPPFLVSQLPDRAGRMGLVCWEEVAAAAIPEAMVSFMAFGVIDGSEGEVYRIEEENAIVIYLFASPDCRLVASVVPEQPSAPD